MVCIVLLLIKEIENKMKSLHLVLNRTNQNNKIRQVERFIWLFDSVLISRLSDRNKSIFHNGIQKNQVIRAAALVPVKPILRPLS